MVRQRVRIRFCKQGDLRWIGHRDLATALARWFRRAGLALGMSEGFHPKPRLSFPSALAVGIAGLDEVLELELAEETTAGSLLDRLAERPLPGVSIVSIEFPPPGARKARLRSSTYEAPVPAERRAAAAERAARLLTLASCPIRRPHRSSPVDLRPSVAELSLAEGVLRMRLLAGSQATAGPRDVLAALGLEDLEQAGCPLARTRVEIEP
ncbi:MAG: TIGR03936 family radical SAM-associated protein [Thermoguttaceae bacterium]